MASSCVQRLPFQELHAALYFGVASCLQTIPNSYYLEKELHDFYLDSTLDEIRLAVKHCQVASHNKAAISVMFIEYCTC